MLSFHNDPAIKEKYLSRLREHAKLDHITQGTGWENGKGCAIGCTLEKYDHKQYEVELGIPTWLAKLEDTLFEAMPNKEAKEFPVKFLKSIPVGADLEQVKAPFLIYLMEFVLNCFDNDQYPEVTKAIKDVIYLYQSNETDVEKYEEAFNFAYFYAYKDAYYAAYAAAYAAYAAYACFPADCYSSSVSYALEYKKKSAIKISNKLIELLKECK